LIWNAIETKTQLREVNYRLWPAGIQELKSHLFIVTNNFTDVQAEEFVRPELEEQNGVPVWRRTVEEKTDPSDNPSKPIGNNWRLEQELNKDIPTGRSYWIREKEEISISQEPDGEDWQRKES